MSDVTLAYRADPAITKAVFVAEMRAHRDADAIAQGTYGDNDAGHFRGCAVGCGVESINRRAGLRLRHGDHAALAQHLGVPEWLEHVQDRIFEGLPSAEARDWPVAFAEAIPDGADLSGVYRVWMPRVLREIAIPAGGDSVRGVIERVARGIETDWAEDDQSAAWAAAGAAARAAAGAAARAAWAAWAAAEAAASRLMASMLLEALRSAPVPGSVA